MTIVVQGRATGGDSMTWQPVTCIKWYLLFKNDCKTSLTNLGKKFHLNKYFFPTSNHYTFFIHLIFAFNFWQYRSKCCNVWYKLKVPYPKKKITNSPPLFTSYVYASKICDCNTTLLSVFTAVKLFKFFLVMKLLNLS